MARTGLCWLNAGQPLHADAPPVPLQWPSPGQDPAVPEGLEASDGHHVLVRSTDEFGGDVDGFDLSVVCFLR